jgi:hypothetical protein
LPRHQRPSNTQPPSPSPHRLNQGQRPARYQPRPSAWVRTPTNTPRAEVPLDKPRPVNQPAPKQPAGFCGAGAAKRPRRVLRSHDIHRYPKLVSRSSPRTCALNPPSSAVPALICLFHCSSFMSACLSSASVSV